jgi:hypothetical protein
MNDNQKVLLFSKRLFKTSAKVKNVFGHLKWNEIKMEMKEDDSTEETRNCRI